MHTGRGTCVRGTRRKQMGGSKEKCDRWREKKGKSKGLKHALGRIRGEWK